MQIDVQGPEQRRPYGDRPRIGVVRSWQEWVQCHHGAILLALYCASNPSSESWSYMYQIAHRIPKRPVITIGKKHICDKVKYVLLYVYIDDKVNPNHNFRPEMNTNNIWRGPQPREWDTNTSVTFLDDKVPDTADDTRASFSQSKGTLNSS